MNRDLIYYLTILSPKELYDCYTEFIKTFNKDGNFFFKKKEFKKLLQWAVINLGDDNFSTIKKLLLISILNS